jgi:hypothetical protein
MAQYFFHLCDGVDLLMDPDGREIEDAGEIAAIALCEARVCISQDALEGRIDFTQTIQVRDDKGELVYLQRFSDAVMIFDNGND